MKAFYAAAYGGISKMRYGDVPDPRPRRGEVLVAVRASSINPLDWRIRNGDLRPLSGWRFPKILGVDFAGVVASDGAALARGVRVYGAAAIFRGRPGGHAELIPIAAKSLRAIPEAISFEDAAALPVAGLSALNGLRRAGPLAGRSVLVNGATGGVGHLALQIAKARGARVTAVCSARNEGLARALGADEVLDRGRGDLEGSGRSWDVVFDAWGGMGFERAGRVLAPTGVYATTLPLPRVWREYVFHRLRGGKRRLVPAFFSGRPGLYAELEELVVAGRVKPVVELVVPLERAVEALDASERHALRGKAIVRVASS
jgi:NADPH:quinone reductase-like Zn-dependent oxidoreductase